MLLREGWRRLAPGISWSHLYCALPLLSLVIQTNPKKKKNIAILMNKNYKDIEEKEISKFHKEKSKMGLSIII